MSLHCPNCNGPMEPVEQCLVIYPVLRMSHKAVLLICAECPAATEVFSDSRLTDFSGLTVSHLYESHPGQYLRRTDRTLRPVGALFERES